MSHRPLSVMLRELLEKEIADAEVVVLVDLVAAAHRRVKRDREFKEAVLDDGVGRLVAEALRSFSRRHNLNETEFGYVTDGSLDVRARELMAKMYGSIGPGRRKAVLAMVKPELLYMVDERQTMIDGLERFNGWVLDLVSGLPDEETSPDRHYSDDELDEIWLRNFGDAGRSG